MNPLRTVNEKIGGFVVTSVKSISDSNSILYEMVHEISGSKLLFHSTSDTNKLFSVTFKTIPENSNGVFHILEHSVLLGSEKYPKRDPFQDLLKGSLKTFLNAMTFPEHTMYPVSSRNEKDFMNLVSVYLDMVFRPMIYRNKHAFFQEGWHYESDENGKMNANGVVYNEMKGVESAVDARMNYALMQLLYPDTSYRFVSGGKTEEIPSLTYEDFVQTHERFYRPDNAIFYLEGNIDIGKITDMIEEYMHAPSDAPDLPSFVKQERKPAERSVVCYPISSEEETEGRTNFLFGKILCDFDEIEKIYASMLLGTFLTSSMAAPLSQSIIANGLAQDVTMAVNNSIYQPNITINVNNSNESCLNDICSIVNELRTILGNKELLKAELEPLITNFEFHEKENEEPKALYNNIDVLNTYLFGGNAEDYLCTSKVFRTLRNYLDTNYYVDLLNELLDIDSYSIITGIPVRDKYEEEAAEELSRISNRWNELSDEEQLNMAADLDEYYQWQQTVGEDEKTVKVPLIGIGDIDKMPEEKRNISTECDGISVLIHPADISDMAYVNLYFPVPNSYVDRISQLSILTNLLTNVETTDSDVMTLQNKIRSHMGSLDFNLMSFPDRENLNECKTYFAVNASYLKSTAKDAVKCVHEVINRTVFDNQELLSNLLTGLLDMFREKIIAGGDGIGALNTLSSWSAANALNEMSEGITCYSFLKNVCENYDSEKEMFTEVLTKALEDIFTQDKLLIGLTIPQKDYEGGNYFEEYGIHELIEGIRKGEEKVTTILAPVKRENVFVQIPAAISYAAAGVNYRALGMNYTPAFQIAMKILSMDFLWDEIRVRGGAYGTGIVCGFSGNVSFSTYRDPAATESLNVLKRCAEYLREFADSEENLEPYIIGAIADSEPLYGPSTLGSVAEEEYLCGFDYGFFCRHREGLLNTDKEDLRTVADMLDQLVEHFVCCIVGPQKNGFNEEKTVLL